MGNILTSVMTHKNLKEVNFSSNGLGSNEALLISSALKINPALEILNLDGNKFNNDDMRLFANALKKIQL